MALKRRFGKDMVAVEGAKFIVVALKAGGVEPVYDGTELMRFSDGKSAAECATRLTEITGIKHQPRPVNDAKWREREATRMEAKDYLHLPWHKEAWWLELKDIWGDHFPHVSIHNGALVAFTENDEKGSADVQTPIRLGKYLQQFFGDSNKLNQYIIRDLCSVFATKYEDNLLLWADSPEDFEEIYTTGPSSCMSHAASHFKTPLHPARAYAAGDLRLAYLKRDGRVVARSLVYEEKKKFSRIYGDTARLQTLLTKNGYKSGSPVGARMSKIKMPAPGKDGFFHFVVPHIDDVPCVHVDGEFLRVGAAPGADSEANSLTFPNAIGYSEIMGHICQRCSKGDLTPRGVQSVYIDEGKNSAWCRSCSKDHAFQCEHSGYLVSKEQGILVEGPADSNLVWKKYAKERVTLCEGTGKLFKTADTVQLADGRRWSRTHFKTHGKNCAACGSVVARADCVGDCKWLQRHKELNTSLEQSMYNVKAGSYTTFLSSTGTNTNNR